MDQVNRLALEGCYVRVASKLSAYEGKVGLVLGPSPFPQWEVHVKIDGQKLSFMVEELEMLEEGQR